MQNLWDTAKSVIKRKYTALSTFIRREERLKTKSSKHSNKKDGSILQKTSSYELPLESLMSVNYDNLYAIGKILGADFYAHSALRVQKSCMSMGEAVAKYIAKNKI